MPEFVKTLARIASPPLEVVGSANAAGIGRMREDTGQGPDEVVV